MVAPPPTPKPGIDPMLIVAILYSTTNFQALRKETPPPLAAEEAAGGRTYTSEEADAASNREARA